MKGIRLAVENGLVFAVLESDALSVVDAIHLKFVPHAKVAHGLARLALDHVGEFVWLDDCSLSMESGPGGLPRWTVTFGSLFMNIPFQKLPHK
ncbi:hypothetical protein Q3G72_009700 [Acer saccharum]|nr:hypothetical protein Q3G72_009700 [Acer saccharum]